MTVECTVFEGIGEDGMKTESLFTSLSLKGLGTSDVISFSSNGIIIEEFSNYIKYD